MRCGDGMPRYKITLEYDGTPYAGWQKQEHMPSVQETLERAIFSFAQEDVTALCAGRTDAGVHACGQVAHFDLSKNRTPFEVAQGLNFHLIHESVCVLNAEMVSDEFHARFDANLRRYEYKIINRRAHPKLLRHRAWHVPRELDADAMHQAAQLLLGKHDFTSFRDAHCQSKSPLKTLDRLDVVREGEIITIHTQARSFLHHQVRNMVGSLSWVGSGRWQIDDMKKALDTADRTAAGPTAPAHGLYLMEVGY